MNEKQQRNHDFQERLIEFAVRVLDVVESLPNSILSFPSSLHHSLLDIRYSILTSSLRIRVGGSDSNPRREGGMPWMAASSSLTLSRFGLLPRLYPRIEA